LHVQESRGSNRCCVDVLEVRVGGKRVTVCVGDQVWWQSRKLLWTPAGSLQLRCGDDFDVCLPRLGYTYASSHATHNESKGA
jgi:hypothetical protein